ncbi:DUF6525 family protein [Chelatococcus asaccharovorans]|uniref:Uncharacterized protein n=1 Tax=Chelatococcus asaccharovorans TaxID=28210 RepID=A0A2V3UBN4_9HYPH|nr:hypothetical protein C7450_10333 [Chelatococcus asaccharovorans]
MAGNWQSGWRVSRKREFQRFDALPPSVRQIVSRAPYPYVVAGIVRQLRKHLANGGDAATFRNSLIAGICLDIQRSARKTYGKHHPDALRSRLEGLRAGARP